MMKVSSKFSALLLVLSLTGLVQGFVPAAVRTPIVVAKVGSNSLRLQQKQQQQQYTPIYNNNNKNNDLLSLFMATPEQETETKSTNNNLPFWLDVGTKGGALVVSLILFIVPIMIYSFVTSVLGFDEIEAGKWIGVGFTAIATFLWVGTYIFRVATKDMTYAKQLKDYENAVIAKRLEELDDDEIQALVEEIDRDEF